MATTAGTITTVNSTMARSTVSDIEAKLQGNHQGAELSREELETLQEMLLTTSDNSNDSPIPHLERWNSTTGRLVLYRGMVQDMLDSEYYYRGDATTNNMANNNGHKVHLADQMGERQPLFLVPLPFCSEWVAQQPDQKQRKAELPPRGDDDMNDNDDSMIQESKKRDREEHQEQDSSCKKHQSSSPRLGSPKAPREFSFPLSNEKPATKRSWLPGFMGSNPRETPVLAHFYYENNHMQQQAPLLLNDMVDVIGMLDAPLELSQDEEEDSHNDNCCTDEGAFFDDDEGQLPPDLPRLHALCYRRLNDVDALWSSAPKESGNMEVEEGSTTGEDDAMESIQNTFTEILGSTAAAEALLLSLFSQAEREGGSGSSVGLPIKTPLDATLGCASLKFVLPTTEACVIVAQQLQSVLQELLPIVGRIDLKNDDENTFSLPNKRNGLLQTSPLQLPRGSMLLIVDQCSRQHGAAPQEALQALQALENMTKNHVVSYCFDGGMRFNFEADYRVLVLSASLNSTEELQGTLTMDLSSCSDNISGFCPQWSRNQIVQMRAVLRRRSSNVALPHEPLLEKAQQDFVKRRKLARAANSSTSIVEADDFHRWLTLTRLEARRQRRPTEATVGDWKNALRVDDAMKSQL